MEVDDI